MKALKITAVLTALGLMAAASCTGNFEKVNDDPNRLLFGQVNASNIFEPLIYGIGGRNQYHTGYWVNCLTQYTTFVSGATRMKATGYSIGPGDWQSVWNDYARFGGDAQHMIELARTEGKEDPYFEALGLILKAYSLYTLSSIYGDIPYTEAYKFTENLTPAFESQEAVLGHVIDDLDAATALIAAGAKPEVTGIDPVYADNTARWRKFANSLRMRALCLATGIDDSYWDKIQEMIDEPSKYPVFTSNSDNAAVTFKDVDPYRSSVGPTEVPSYFGNYNMSEQIIGMMDVKDESYNDVYQDPRLEIFATQKGGKWTGAVSGALNTEYQTEMNKKPAEMNAKVLHRDDTESFIMDWSEILFIEAEGVMKGKLTVPGETAKSLYEAAVRANIEKWAPYIRLNTRYRDISNSAIVKYLESELASYDMAEAGEGRYGSVEELVMSQKWLSLYWVGGWEAYAHWRRTEYPILTIGDGTSANNYELPTRFGYPNYTVSTNGANVSSALSRMGGNNDMHLPLDWSYKKKNGGNRNPHPQATN